MRYAASEKLEIIRLVKDHTCLLNGHWRSWAYHARLSIAGMIGIYSAEKLVLKIANPIRGASGTAFPTRCAKPCWIWHWNGQNLAHESWRSPSLTNGVTSSLRPVFIGFYGPMTLITSPAFIVMKAASEFRDKTTAPNQLWQTDFTYLKVIGWGWFYCRQFWMITAATS